MPLYEYQCEACGHRFEVIQKYSDAPIAVCPKCGGAVRKLFSSPAIQFKGSGFYITDYARGAKPEGEGASGAKAESGNGTGDAKPAGTEGAKSDSKAEKPATKDAAKSESKSDSKAEPKSSSKPSASKLTSD